MSVFLVNVHPTIGHMVSSGLKVGAARGSQKLGQTSPEVGGHIVPVHEDQGGELAGRCKRPDHVGVLGRRVCFAALVRDCRVEARVDNT